MGFLAEDINSIVFECFLALVNAFLPDGLDLRAALIVDVGVDF